MHEIKNEAKSSTTTNTITIKKKSYMLNLYYSTVTESYQFPNYFDSFNHILLD